MIKPIAHRGLWKKPHEKNSLIAFERAIALGVGIETDVRDHIGVVVISHDFPDESSLEFESVMDLISPGLIRDNLSLCINVKSDGLSSKLQILLSKYQGLRYYIFDAAIPELFQYKKKGMPFLYRLSEYEMPSLLLEESSGIWYDKFHGDSISEEEIFNLLKHQKELFIVSPELHGHDNHDFLESLNRFPLSRDIFLCTDEVEKVIDLFRRPIDG